MTYNCVKITVLTLILCFSAVGASFAQNNLEAMRFLTVNALMQYGQKLYDRGDFNNACAVFNHVLSYDKHQSQAIQYLKDMGHLPASSEHLKPVKKLAHRPLRIVDMNDTADLKKAISDEKRVIAKLKFQVTQMRANLIAQSAEE
jgi:hypothetical protein